jgi:hypothetical protein
MLGKAQEMDKLAAARFGKQAQEAETRSSMIRAVMRNGSLYEAPDDAAEE